MRLRRLLWLSCVCGLWASSGLRGDEKVPPLIEVGESVRDLLKASAKLAGRIDLVYEETADRSGLLELLEQQRQIPPPPGVQVIFPMESVLVFDQHLHERRSYTIDYESKRLKAEIIDLRDIDAAVATGLLPDDRARRNALKTGTALQDWDHPEDRLFWAHYMPARRSITLELMPQRHGSIYQPPVTAGILPLRDLEGIRVAGATVAEVDEGGRRLFRLTGREDPRGVTREAILDPEMDYRLRSFEVRRNGSVLRRVSAGDYRDAGATVYPFLQELERLDPAGNILKSVKIRVQSASFGEDILADQFTLELPAGTRVGIVNLRIVRDYALEEDMVLALDTLKTLTLQVKEITEQTGPVDNAMFNELLRDIHHRHQR